MTEWNFDMEAAPRTGEPVLLWPHMLTASWDFGAEDWIVMRVPLNEDFTISDDWNHRRVFYEVMATAFGVQPTAWQPLPTPPDPSSTRKA